MVRSSLPALALVALAASVAAVPTTGTTSAVPFTFTQWIEDIIANPNGDHLTPEEAVQAKNAAVAQASSNTLEKRTPRCQDGFKDAPANDAAACLQYLAKKGAAGVNCGIGQNQFSIEMCRIGGASVVSSKSTSTAQGANCNNVARTGGKIFDSCWRADNTVKGSELCLTNSLFQVNIVGT